MFSLPIMPSTSSVFSTYTTFAGSAFLVRTVFNEIQTMATQLIPQRFQDKLLSRVESIFGKFSNQMMIIIDESSGLSVNEIYRAAELYLSTRIGPTVKELKVSQGPKEKSFSITINKGQTIVDTFQRMQLTWKFVSAENQKTSFDDAGGFYSTEKSERKSILLTFHKKCEDEVMNTYLPYVVERSKSIRETKRVVKLYSLGGIGGDYDGPWESINFKHPSTFDTLAMDPVLKKELVDDLDRFVKRSEFYQRVGKAWKRGYLLYGPPGTGKSSLIAAIANYLKFDIYDMELTSIRRNSDLRRLIVATRNRSILVIEDIDCSINLENRVSGEYKQNENQLTLSGLLNFVDGLWSSCGDERIIVFTTNFKERIDPALLRPGRMDMHIHMSYLTPSGFKILASNYLKINSHSLFDEIDQLLTEMEVSPAEVAEELMKSDNADIALKRLVDFLEKKKEQSMKRKEYKVEEEEKKEDEQENKRRKIEEENEKKNAANKNDKNKRKPAKRGKGRR